MNTHTLPQETTDLLVNLRENDKEEFHNYVKALVDNKWSLRSIAAAVGSGHSIVKVWKDSAEGPTRYPVPEVPRKLKESSSRPVKPEVEIPTSDQKRILELTQQASMVRGRTPQDSPYRQAARELEDLLFHYKELDVSYKRLSEIAQVSRRAIAQRLESRARRVSTDA
jgi:hypothetical protein